MSPNPLRNIPSVNELLENPALKTLVDRVSHNAVVMSVRSVLDEIRGEFQDAAAEGTFPSVAELAERVAGRVLQGEEPSLRPVINATGILLHTGLAARHCPKKRSKPSVTSPATTPASRSI